MKRLRVVALMHEDLIPPETDEGMSDDEKAKAPWWSEYDVVHALQKLGHDVHILGVTDDLMPLRRLVEGWRPHVVFNLLNELADIGAYEVHVASYLELLGVPYTGCNSRGLMLARDKPLSKKIFRYHRIPNPAFAVLPTFGFIFLPAEFRWMPYNPPYERMIVSLYLALAIPSVGNFGVREFAWAELFQGAASADSLYAFAFATNAVFLLLNVVIGIVFLRRALGLLEEMRRTRRRGDPVPEPLLHDATDP